MSSINNDKNRTFKGIPELYFNSTYDPNLVREQAIENENLLYKKCLQTQREACAMGYTFGKMTDFKIDPAINRKYGLGFRTYTFSVNNTFLNYYSEKNTLRRSTIEGHVYSALDTCRMHTVFKREILFFIENLLYINLKIIPLQKNTIFAIDVGSDGLDEEYLKSKIVTGADWKVLLLPCSNYYLKEATGAAMIDAASTGIKVDAFQGDDLDGCNKPIGRNSYFLFVSDSASRKNLLSMSLTTKTQTVFSIASPEYIAKVKAMPTCKFFIINLPNMGKQVLLGNVRNFQIPLNLRPDCPSTPIPPENLLVMTRDNQYGTLSPVVDGNMTLFYPNVYSISGAPTDANLSVLAFISEKVSTKFQNPISHYMEYKGSDYIAMCVNDTLPEVLKAYNPEDVKLSAENYLASNAVHKISADQFVLDSLMEYLSDDVDRYTKHFSKVDQLDRSLRSFEIDTATAEFTKQPSILNNSEIMQNQTFGFGVNAINFETPVKWFAISKSKEGNCALNVFVDGYFYDENMTITDSKNILAYVYIHEADLKNDSKIMIDCMTDLSSDELVRLNFKAVNADVPFPVTTKYFSDQGLVFYNKTTSERIPNSHFVYRAYIGLETYFILTKSLEFTQSKNLEYLVTSHHLSMAEASGFNKKIDYRTTKENIQMTDYAGYTTPVKNNTAEVSNPNKQTTFTEDMVLVKLDGEPDSICFPVKVSVDGTETLEFSRYIGDLSKPVTPVPDPDPTPTVVGYESMVAPAINFGLDDMIFVEGSTSTLLTNMEIQSMAAPYALPVTETNGVLKTEATIGVLPSIAACNKNLLGPHITPTLAVAPSVSDIGNIKLTVNANNEFVINGTTGSIAVSIPIFEPMVGPRGADYCLIPGSHTYTLSDPSAHSATAKHKMALMQSTVGKFTEAMGAGMAASKSNADIVLETAQVVIDKTTEFGTLTLEFDPVDIVDTDAYMTKTSAKFPMLSIVLNANETFVDYVIQPQLEFGSTKTAYEAPSEMIIYADTRKEIATRSKAVDPKFMLMSVGNVRDRYYPLGAGKIIRAIHRLAGSAELLAAFVKTTASNGTGSIWTYSVPFSALASNSASVTSRISLISTEDPSFMSLAAAGTVETTMNRYEVRNNGDGTSSILISADAANAAAVEGFLSSSITILITRETPVTERMTNQESNTYGIFDPDSPMTIIGPTTALKYPKSHDSGDKSLYVYDTPATKLYIETPPPEVPLMLSLAATPVTTAATDTLVVSDHKYEAFYIPKRIISPSSTISIERLIAPKDVILAGNLTFDQTPEIRIAAKDASDLNVEIGARSADFHEVLGYQLVNPGESITKYNFKGANSKSRIRVWTLANPADTSHYKKMVLVDPSLYNVEFSPTVGLSDSYVRILFTNTGNGPIWYYAEYLPYKYQLVHRYQDITANASSVIDFQNNLDRPIDCDGYDIYANGVRLNSNHYKVLTASKIKLDASIDPNSSILVFERGHDADVYGNQYIHREIEDTLMDTDRYFAAYMKNL